MSSCLTTLSLISGFRCHLSDPLIVCSVTQSYETLKLSAYTFYRKRGCAHVHAFLIIPEEDQDLQKIAATTVRRYRSNKEFIFFHVTEAKGNQNVPCAVNTWAPWLMRSYMVPAARVDIYVMSFFPTPSDPSFGPMFILESMHFHWKARILCPRAQNWGGIDITKGQSSYTDMKYICGMTISWG